MLTQSIHSFALALLQVLQGAAKIVLEEAKKVKLELEEGKVRRRRIRRRKRREEEEGRIWTGMLRSLGQNQTEIELPPVMKLLLKEAWRTWMWAGSNAWLLANLMALSQVTGDALQMDANGIDSNVSPQDWYTPSASGEFQCNEVGYQYHQHLRVQKLVGGMGGGDTFNTLLSLCFIFIVGVTTGMWWKTIQKVEEEVVVQQSREIMMVEPPSGTPPASSSSGTGTSSTPKISRSITVGTVTQYSLTEIYEMTEGFKLELGRGGQGIVYFAKSLPDENLQRPMAVKKLQEGATNLRLLQQKLDDLHHDRNQQEAIEKEFWGELNTISRLHHRNLVALLGYCFQDEQLFLVYEYMANGSLDQHLHPDDARGATTLFDWKARMRCALEVAQGLEYLHSHANPTLVHRDIKSSNILFDDDMQAKIADFGLSKPVFVGHTVTVSTRVRGTHGYVDPVYLINGKPCDKNDVYSYGVVLLELITGRRAIQSRVGVVAWCKDFLADEPVMRHLLPRMVDSRISVLDYNYDQLWDVVKVAQMCVEDKQEHRPSMKDVVVQLYNANCKDYSSSEVSIDTVVDFFGSNGSGSTFNCTSLERPPVYSRTPSALPCYEIKENTIIVKCTVGNSKIALRCKIWPTPKNFGLNKVEATLNGAFLWKKGLWWYNAKSRRDFYIDDDVKLTAEWHVALRTSKYWLAANDPRRSQGPFCVDYLALRDGDGKPLIEYHGDKSPLPEPNARSRRIAKTAKILGPVSTNSTIQGCTQPDCQDCKHDATDHTRAIVCCALPWAAPT